MINNYRTSESRKIFSLYQLRFLYIFILSIFVHFPSEIILAQKQEAIIVPTSSLGDITETKKRILENTFTQEISNYYKIIPKDKFEVAQEKAFEELEYEECTEDQCIMLIQEYLQVENVFLMQLLVEDDDTQINIIWTTLDEKRNKEFYCSECNTKQLRKEIKLLVLALLDAKPVILQPKSDKGDLLLLSKPTGAKIYINDILQNELTNFRLDGLNSGSTKIELVKDDFSIVKNVFIKPNELNEIFLTLKKTKSNVFVTSEPSGAYVYVDKRRIGRTPIELNLEVGDHLIDVDRFGWARVRKKINILKGKNEELFFKLKKSVAVELTLKREHDKTWVRYFNYMNPLFYFEDNKNNFELEYDNFLLTPKDFTETESLYEFSTDQEEHKITASYKSDKYEKLEINVKYSNNTSDTLDIKLKEPYKKYLDWETKWHASLAGLLVSIISFVDSNNMVSVANDNRKEYENKMENSVLESEYNEHKEKADYQKELAKRMESTAILALVTTGLFSGWTYILYNEEPQNPEFFSMSINPLYNLISLKYDMKL